MRSVLRITTPAESKNLTVLSSVKRELGIEADDTSQDERLEDLICTASDIVTAYCDRSFARESVVETFYPDRPRCFEQFETLVLARTPIEAIESVVHDGSELATSDYTFDASAGFLFRLSPFPSPFFWTMFGSIEVTYTGGYLLLDGLPRGVERATIALCKEFHYGGGRDPRVKTESTPGVYSVDYWIGATGPSGELPPDVVALLEPYKRIHA